jgi:hypothetical protein
LPAGLSDDPDRAGAGAGVSIALQVNDWNQARQGKDRGLVYLSRIENELARDIHGLAVCIDHQTHSGDPRLCRGSILDFTSPEIS